MLSTITRFALGFAIGYGIAYCFTTLINQEVYKMDEHGDEHLTWEDEQPALYNYELAEILADYKRDQEGER